MPGLRVFLFFCLRLLLLLIAVIFSFTAKSQLCNGSLGDPVVNITFGGSGTGGGTSYSAPANSYTYTSTSCPNDGYYTITVYTSNCYNNTWHTLSSDRTGGGSFMLVNASYNPSDFFVATVTDLCPNTTYEFAAWIINVMKPIVSIRPDITFSIETPGGTVLNSFNTGNIDVTSSPEWKQYGFFFTTPQNNAVVVLRMTNKAPGGYGNDLALDDITFRPCGSKITAAIQGNSTDTVDVCEGNANVYTFDGNVSSNYQSPVYQWQLSTDSGATWKDIAGANTISYIRQPTAAGNFWYRLAVVERSVYGMLSCRIASNQVVINVYPKPIIDAGPDRVMISGNPIILNGRAEGEQIVYNWSPDIYMNDITEIKPSVSPPSDIIYTLYAVSAYGCTNEDKVRIRVVAGIFVPTAFTPNGDGKNDSWEIPFLDPSFAGEVSVFNRWGQLVYHVKGATVSWDGKLNGLPQASGVYVYMVNFKTGNLKSIKGTVTLIR